MNKSIKEIITTFIYTSIVLLFILGWVILPITLIQEGHPICAFFIFSFLSTLFIDYQRM